MCFKNEEKNKERIGCFKDEEDLYTDYDLGLFIVLFFSFLFIPFLFFLFLFFLFLSFSFIKFTLIVMHPIQEHSKIHLNSSRRTLLARRQAEFCLLIRGSLIFFGHFQHSWLTGLNIARRKSRGLDRWG